MTKTLQYILILLFINPTFCFAQTKGEEWRYEGPRIGIDLSRFLLPMLGPGNRFGWEVQGDIPYKGNFFPTAELGMQWFDNTENGFHYMNNGGYARIGIDMNIVKFESLKDHDIVFFGLRYGFTHFTQAANNITYTNYWGTINTSIPQESLNAHWAEFVFGMKGEIFNNIFLGWTLRAKFPFYQTKDLSVKPYIIPGIGKTTGEVPADFSFTVSYRIPLFKTKTLPKPFKVGGAKHPNENQEDQQEYPGGRSQTPMGPGNMRY